MSLSRLLVFLIGLGCLLPTQAQSTFTLYDSGNSGLPFDQVTALAQDDGGTLWVGTEFGLGAFDGSSWQTWFSSFVGMPDDVIRSLAVDPDGRRIWVGHFLGGLSRYDPLTNAWDVWTSFDTPLPDNFIRDLVFAPDGALWIGTTGGLARFDPVANTWETWTTASSDLPGNNIPAIFIEEDGTPWVGTINSGLARYNGKGWENWTIANSALIDNTILDLDMDAAGNLWMATPAGGLALRTPGGAFLIVNSTNSDIPDNELARLAVNGDTMGWVGFTAFGLATFNDGTWTRWFSGNTNLPDDNIRALLRTPGDTLWAGMLGSGLARLDPMTTALPGPSAEGPTLGLPVGPNPFQNTLHWQGGDWQRTWTWSWWSLDGRLLAQGTGQPGERLIPVPDALPAGACRLTVQADGKEARHAILWHAR